MLWISCNPSVAQRRRETDRCPVEFPTAHSLFESCEKLFWSHSRSGRKLALLERRHQQFYMCAADIDDQNFSFHERRPIPEIFGVRLPVALARAAKTLKESLPFWFCRRAARPAFHHFEGEKPEQQLLRRFQIEPQVLRNLLHGPSTIELGRELGLVCSQLQPLDSLETIFGVSGN